MRHGTTVWNEIGKTQGHSNNRLSKGGIALVRQTAKKHSKTKFDIIISSPLMRTMQTSNIMNEYHNVKIVKDRRLIEIDQGVFTGMYHKNFTPEQKEIRRRRDANYGIESYKSVYDRVYNFLTEIINNPPADNILIVTHNAPATMMEKIITNQQINWQNTSPPLFNIFDNTQVKHFNL